MSHRMAGMSFATLAVIVTLAAAPPAGSRPAGAEDAAVTEVAGLEDARRAAMVAADTTALTSLLDERCTYVHSNGLEQSRGELLRALASGEMRYLSITVEHATYRTFGATVVGTGTQTLKVASAGRQFSLRSRYTAVYAGTSGGFRLVAYQSTPLPEGERQDKKE